MMTKEKRKVAIVTAIELLPIDCGKKVVLNGVAEYLCERLGESSVHWIFVGGMNQKNSSHWNGMSVHRLHGATGKQKIFQLMKSLLLRKFSFQEAVFRGNKNFLEVNSLIRELNPDLLVVDTVRLAALVDPIELKKRKSVLYLEDLFSVRYKLILDQMNAGIYDASAVLGNFADKIPKAARLAIEKSKSVRKWILRRESSAIRDSEIVFGGLYSSALLVNPNEVQLLKNRGVRGAKEIPPYLSVKADFCREAEISDFYVFLGDLTLPHNESGLLDFSEKHLPHILQKYPNFKLLIIGKSPSDKLKAILEPHFGKVEILGFVPDLDGLLASCRGMIVPLIFGSGVKLKTLDAISRGVPLLSTNFGVEGIPVVNGEHYIEVAKTSDYINAIATLSDDQKNREFSKKAAALFRERYSRQAVFNVYDSLF